MGLEIERKFLLLNDNWRKNADDGVHILQGYLLGEGNVSVRCRLAGDRGSINIKSATPGVRRHEYDYEIPAADARHLLEGLCSKPLVSKTRFHVNHRAHTWEIDVFDEDNAGLVVAEIELSSEDEHFERPEWLGQEVSHELRYYNTELCRRPYSSWSDKEKANR